MKKLEYAKLTCKPVGTMETYLLQQCINGDYTTEEIGQSLLGALNTVGQDGWEVIGRVGFREHIWLRRESYGVTNSQVRLPYDAVCSC